MNLRFKLEAISKIASGCKMLWGASAASTHLEAGSTAPSARYVAAATPRNFSLRNLFLRWPLIGFSIFFIFSAYAEKSSSSSACQLRQNSFSEHINAGKLQSAEGLCLTSEIFSGCESFALDCTRILRDQYHQAQQYEKAIQFGRKVLEQNGFQPKDQWALAILFVDAGKPQNALSFLEKAEADPSLYAEARTRRLMILDSSPQKDAVAVEALWQELLKTSGDQPMVLFAFIFHLIDTQPLEAYRRLKSLDVKKVPMTIQDRNRVDALFFQLSQIVKDESSVSYQKRWSQWVPHSVLMNIYQSEILLKLRKYARALEVIDPFFDRLETGDKFLANYAREANLRYGVILSHLNRHREAAGAFDMCFQQGNDLCEGWLARECAYLGRWDLAYRHWEKQQKLVGISENEKNEIKKLLTQAEKHQASELSDKRLAYPTWMLSRFE